MVLPNAADGENAHPVAARELNTFRMDVEQTWVIFFYLKDLGFTRADPLMRLIGRERGVGEAALMSMERSIQQWYGWTLDPYLYTPEPGY